MDINVLTGKIVGAAINVHRELGPGVLEKVYEVCLVEELIDIGLKVEAQKEIPIIYKGKVLNECFRNFVRIRNLSLYKGSLGN